MADVTLETVMDELTKIAGRHPQGPLYKGLCPNHHELCNVPCDQARALRWLYTLTEHPMGVCPECDGVGWRWAREGEGKGGPFDKVTCEVCLGSALRTPAEPARSSLETDHA